MDDRVKELLDVATKMQQKLIKASELVDTFALASIDLSTEQLLKLKDLSDMADEPSGFVIKSQTQLVKSVKDASDVITLASNWVDRAYSITELTEAILAQPVQLSLPIEAE